MVFAAGWFYHPRNGTFFFIRKGFDKLGIYLAMFNHWFPLRPAFNPLVLRGVVKGSWLISHKNMEFVLGLWN